jgi:hypothetical protein
MYGWKCIHWWVLAFNIIFFRMDAVFSETQVVERIIDFVKRGDYQQGLNNY